MLHISGQWVFGLSCSWNMELFLQTGQRFYEDLHDECEIFRE